MIRNPFPLQWPDGWPRTPSDARERSKFHSIDNKLVTYGTSSHYQKQKGALSLLDECNELLWQLDKLGGYNMTITSNLPTRRDGKPYATRNVDDPGIAVWWMQDGREQVMACDRWETPVENVRALVKTIDALRGIERWGSTAIVKKAFAGFAALPPAGETSEGTGTDHVVVPPAVEPTKAWMEYFHVSEAASRTGIKAMYRAFTQQLHPDRNKGDNARMAELNVAWDQAKAWFDWRDKLMGVKPEEA
jgi:hypothetical protein